MRSEDPQPLPSAPPTLHTSAGSWFDPSNPVVKYSGSLQSDLFEAMATDALDADLVLVLGTSLSGLNADRMASTPAARSITGDCLGFVIINLQQTPQDGEATLRINARTDEVMPMLLERCHLPPLPPGAPPCSASLFVHLPTHVAVPYDRDGNRLPGHVAKLPGVRGDGGGASQEPAPGWMWLDLRDGAAVRLTSGHNVQGAQQPGMMHIGADAPVRLRDRTVVAPAEGYGRVVRCEPASCSFALSIENVPMRLGVWWLEAAARGGPAKLPIVNVSPAFVA